MVERLVYYDYCSLILLSMILISTVLRKMTKGRLNRLFLMLVVTAFIATAADILSITHDNVMYTNMSTRQIENMVYLLAHSMTTPLFASYVTEMTDTSHILRRSRVVGILINVPYIATVTGILSNPLTGWMFGFNGRNQYVRGPQFWLMYISVAVYVVYSLYIMIRFRKSIGIARWSSLMVLLAGMLSAVIMQYFFPKYPVEMFANAVGLLFISVMVQRPEEIMDVESGAMSRNAFASDLQRSFDNNKDFDLIIVKLANLHSFGELLGYDERIGVLKEARARISRECLSKGVFPEVYYLRGGVFALSVDGAGRKRTKALAETLFDAMKEPVGMSHMQINLLTYVCVIDVPVDISDSKAMSDFINSAIPAESHVTYAKDILSSGRYDMIMDMDSIINRAVTEDRLEVYYQPIYSTVDNRFNSAEALIRLNDDKYGFVPPDLFIPAAEKNGMIHKIGSFVLESVCRFISSEEFERLGLDYIEINLSVVQCMNSGLADEIIGMLKKYGVSHDKINLEITETFAAHYQSVMEENIKKLCEAGITFSLDDFGTGYSNMQSIALLPLVITKLDKSFTTMDENDKMALVVSHSIDLIKALKMKIVVEGVETKEMLARFSSLGCEYIQGYYFSKPLPRDEFVSYILEHIDN